MEAIFLIKIGCLATKKVPHFFLDLRESLLSLKQGTLGVSRGFGRGSGRPKRNNYVVNLILSLI